MVNKILTVSIAAYNVSNTLEEALRPFVKSNRKNELEVLIVNDGSTDDTAAIAQKYEKLYPETFRLIDKKNGGWGSTLNAGMKYGTGKYFKQLDGDDYYSEENLDNFIDFLAQTNADMVYSPFVTFTDKNGALLRIIGDYGRYVPTGEIMKLGEVNGFTPAMHAVCFKLDLLKQNNISIMEHCFYTDVEFVLKSLNYCHTMIFYPYPVYCYRLARNGQSMSVGGVRKHYLDHLKMLFTMLEYERKYVVRDSVNEIFQNRLLAVCNYMYYFFFALEGTEKERSELMEYDRRLREGYPDYYYKINNHAVKLLRKLHFHGYKAIARIQTMRDKRRKINIFEGC